MTLTFLFVYCFLFVNRLHSTGHFIAELTLYQTLESPRFADETTVAMSQLIGDMHDDITYDRPAYLWYH